MTFREMRAKMLEHFNEMVKDSHTLFEVNVDKDKLWEIYLDSFPEGTNKLFKKRREYECSHCHHFVRLAGNVVAIKNNKIISIWDFRTDDDTFQPVLDALSAYIRTGIVSDIFVSKQKIIGTSTNCFRHEDGTIEQFHHFYFDLPSSMVNKTDYSIEEIKGRFRDERNVFKRSLDEITMEAVDTVLELINSNTLYKGEEWKSILIKFKEFKEEYSKLTDDTDKDNYAWEKSVITDASITKIKNHSIGVLLMDISDGMDLDIAVKRYEKVVAPANYKRPKAIVTEKMKEEAKKTIIELGYYDSLPRRFANLDDITINNILFANRDIAKRITETGDVFDQLSCNVKNKPLKLMRTEEMSASDFIRNVLPTANEVEVYVENRHEKNLMSLTAPINKDSKNMFKWGNSLGWAYTGNITDSDIKQNVKLHGGDVDGVLRFSIQWNESGIDNSDLDAHCIEPSGFRLYFDSAKKPYYSPCRGQLNVDIIRPNDSMPGIPAVENITYKDKSSMIPGTYTFLVNQYTCRGSKGFKAEIEVDGEIYSYEYNNPLRTREEVVVAEVVLDRNGNFTVKDNLYSSVSRKSIWNITTNQFVPVSAITYSPNYFDEQDGVGHRHLFFFLKDCINPEEPNGFYNEFLKNELMEFKRVLEALGSICKVSSTEDQLSGLGFSMSKRDELVVKVKGAIERIIKIKF